MLKASELRKIKINGLAKGCKYLIPLDALHLMSFAATSPFFLLKKMQNSDGTSKNQKNSKEFANQIKLNKTIIEFFSFQDSAQYAKEIGEILMLAIGNDDFAGYPAHDRQDIVFAMNNICEFIKRIDELRPPGKDLLTNPDLKPPCLN